MTVIFSSPEQDGISSGSTAQIDVFGRGVLEHIPTAGYCDIKEGLIPSLVRAGKTVHAESINQGVGVYRSWVEYLRATGVFLENFSASDKQPAGFSCVGADDVWTGRDVKVDAGARIFGPVMICDGVKISKEAVIFGPAILGRNVKVGRSSLVADSVVWDGGQIGDDCEVKNCLLDYESSVPNGTLAEGKLLGKAGKSLSHAGLSLAERNGFGVDQVKRQQWMAAAAAVIFGAFLWAYWEPVIVDLWRIWLRSDEYSSGLLVPLIAGYILWIRRDSITACRINPSLWGLAGFIGAQAFRLFGLFYWYDSAERLSMVLTLASLVLLLFGWQLFRKVLPVLLFLFLMIPLPNSVQSAITLPLQSWATTSSVFCLEMLGYDIVRQGNVININGTVVAIAEACNGLRMLTAFFVISGLVVMIINRSIWEKIIIFVSSIPIGLICNTLRLTITSIALTVLSTEKWEQVFHDFGGLAMMPVAIGVIVFELWLLSNLVTEAHRQEKEIIWNRSS